MSNSMASDWNINRRHSSPAKVLVIISAGLVLLSVVKGCTSKSDSDGMPNNGQSPASTAAQVKPQLWSGILAPSRATDWTVVGVSGGIPTNRNQCGATIPAYGTFGSPQSSTTINMAIANCSASGGGVVQLEAGTFYLSDSIGFNSSVSNIGDSAQNVTLRGAGPDQTILVFLGQGGGGGGVWCDQGGFICLTSASSGGGQCTSDVNPNTANWTANYAAGTTQIVLDNITGNGMMANNLTVGMYLTLDQLDTPNSEAAAYGPFVSSDPAYALLPCNAQRTGRCLGEYHQVTAIAGTGPYTVTLTPPLAYSHWNIDGTNQPMAWWCENVTQRVLNDGVENLTVDNETGSTLGYGLVQFSGAAQSWMKNVRQINGPQAQVFIYGSANIEIRDSYFYGTINPDGCGVASTQYGIDPANAGLVKVENNIFQQGCSAFQAQPCYVCVFAYNFSVGDLNQMLDQGGGSLAPYVFWAGGPGHVGGTHLLLWEGNELNAFATDHGVSHGTNAMFLTAFRNRFSGVQPTNPISTAQTPNPRNPVHNQAYNRFNNYIGNVLGDPSLAAAGWTYQTYPGFGSDPVATSATGTIFAIGWAVNGTPDDLTTHTSLMRWGNFDYVTNAVRWCGDSGSPGWSTTCNSVTEIPADTVVPSSTTLPASLYLAGKPAWFGNQTWPVIGPDVMSGSDRAGHAGDIPAKRCYLNVMGGPLDGSGPVLAFNASNC